jgi:hypothetical protein
MRESKTCYSVDFQVTGDNNQNITPSSSTPLPKAQILSQIIQYFSVDSNFRKTDFRYIFSNLPYWGMASLFSGIRACAPRIKDCAPRIKACAPRIKACAPRIKDCAPRIKTCALRIKDCAPRIKDCAPRIKDCAPRIKDCAPRIKTSFPRIKRLKKFGVSLSYKTTPTLPRIKASFSDTQPCTRCGIIYIVSC